MISWIQRTFQHHFRIVFGVLLAVLIISFVVTIGAQSGAGAADRHIVARNFFGHNLGSPADYQRLISDARLSVELQLGYAGLDDDRLKDYALQRAAALHFADELRLPAATPTEMEGFIRNLRTFVGQDGQFDAARYSAFRENLKQASGITEEDVARVLADDIRMDRVTHLIDGPGYVLPGDVRDLFLHTETSWTVGVATVDYASFQPAIEPTEAQIAKYFSDNAFRYQIAPRVIASYIEFPLGAHLGEIKVTDAEVRAFYDANPSRFPSKEKAAATPDATFASVRPQVAAALAEERARRAAVKTASDFAFDLYQGKVAGGAPFEAFIASRNLEQKKLAPFSEDGGPAELGGSAEMGSAAFKLNADRYYSEAMPTPAGAAVLIWKDAQPARNPTLLEVRSKVLADYRENERRERFIALGRILKTQLQSRAKAGAAFDKAAASLASENSVAIATKVLPPFTLHSPPAGLDEAVSATLEHLEKGAVSDMVATADKGYLVYAIDRKEPDPKTSAPKLVEIRMQLAATSARSGSSAYLTEMVQNELKRTEAAAGATP